MLGNSVIYCKTVVLYNKIKGVDLVPLSTLFSSNFLESMKSPLSNLSLPYLYSHCFQPWGPFPQVSPLPAHHFPQPLDCHSPCRRDRASSVRPCKQGGTLNAMSAGLLLCFALLMAVSLFHSVFSVCLAFHLFSACHMNIVT